MHFLLAVIGFVVTVAILLKRLADAGITLGGLNPFPSPSTKTPRTALVDPRIYELKNPLQAAGVMLVGVAKVSGDLSDATRTCLLGIIRREFSQTEEEALAFLQVSEAVVGDGTPLKEDMAEVLRPVLPQMTLEQRDSLLEMMEEVAASDDRGGPARRAFLNEAKWCLSSSQSDADKLH